jgi:hypothetical protein
MIWPGYVVLALAQTSTCANCLSRLEKELRLLFEAIKQGLQKIRGSIEACLP